MSNPCFSVLQTTIILELCKIDHWLRANKLNLNYNKTDLILLNSLKRNPTSFEFTINDHNISPIDNLKYLGLLLGNILSWKPHAKKDKDSTIKTVGCCLPRFCKLTFSYYIFSKEVFS